MRIQRLIGAGFATIALASAALPTFAYTVWPDIDFEWYTDVGRPLAAPVETVPAPRAGYIWAPGRYETVDGREAWVAGHFVKDDFADEVARLQRANQAQAS
jgi:hypothetical protein